MTLLPTPVSDNSRGLPSSGTDYQSLPNAVVSLLPTPMVGSANPAAHGQISGDYRTRMADALDHWGDYAPAIARWEAVLGRPAPAPTETGPKGGARLSAVFVEWLMGLPEGHVTDPDIGLTRNQQLRALGNGVVWQQCAAATRTFIHDLAKEPAA